MKPRIPYTKPSITELEVRYATDAAANGWGERCYDYILRFEEAPFATHLGVGYAIATSSCTGALHMGLAALGIGPGDEVIMADTNWIASGRAHRASGAEAGVRRHPARLLVSGPGAGRSRPSRRAPRPSSRFTCTAISATMDELLTHRRAARHSGHRGCGGGDRLGLARPARRLDGPIRRLLLSRHQDADHRRRRHVRHQRCRRFTKRC
jgi:hypothetical protein